MGYGDGESENCWGIDESGPPTRCSVALIRSLFFGGAPARKPRRRKGAKNTTTHRGQKPSEESSYVNQRRA